MTRGRKPKPTALKLLAGNPGKRELDPAEAKPEAKLPDCPQHLSEIARAEWDRLGPELLTLGLISDADRAAFAAYCQTWARWVEAEASLREHGVIVKSPNGFPVQNPYLAVANKAISQMKTFLTEFGLTPSSRSRVKAITPEKEDPIDAFLTRGKSSA